MDKPYDQALHGFPARFPAAVQKTARHLLRFVRRACPGANELACDNYNALAVGWSPTDRVTHTFCSIAVGRSNRNVHFGFYRGAHIPDPEKRLIGNGRQYRYFLVQDLAGFPEAYLRQRMHDAYAYSLSRVKDPAMRCSGQRIVKSVAATRRKPAAKKKKA